MDVCGFEKNHFYQIFLDDTFCGSMLMDLRKLISLSFLWMIYVVDRSLWICLKLIFFQFCG
jgi:hypothetical protein